MRDEFNLKSEVDFHCPFLTCITIIFTIYLQQNQYLSSFCFSRCKYVPETLAQKNNMGILGNDIRIKYKNNGLKHFGKYWKE